MFVLRRVMPKYRANKNEHIVHCWDGREAALLLCSQHSWCHFHPFELSGACLGDTVTMDTKFSN